MIVCVYSTLWRTRVTNRVIFNVGMDCCRYDRVRSREYQGSHFALQTRYIICALRFDLALSNDHQNKYRPHTWCHCKFPYTMGSELKTGQSGAIQQGNKVLLKLDQEVLN